MLELATVKDYLDIDYEDAATNRNLLRLIGVAEKYLVGALGEQMVFHKPITILKWNEESEQWLPFFCTHARIN